MGSTSAVIGFGGLLALLINLAFGAVAIVLQTEHFFDAVGALTFIALAVCSLVLDVGGTDGEGTIFDITDKPFISWRQYVASALVVVWALRLGGFLAYRVHKVGTDVRFDEIKTQPLRFLVFWIGQAAWGFLVTMPVLVVNSLDQSRSDAALNALDVIAIIIWVVGFSFEVTADIQKFNFKMNPANKGKWIEEGVWRLSRHPNYFGEISLWFGVFLFGASVYETWDFLAVCSPLFTAFLLIKASGLPMLEAGMKRRWGSEPEFQAYMARVPIMIPRPCPARRPGGPDGGQTLDLPA